MKRTLLFNWHPNHEALQRAIADGVKEPREVMETGKGWTYVTFVKPGTRASEVLFDVDRLDRLARAHGYYLPREVVARHNKVVVTARSSELGPSAQLFALVRFLEAFAKRHADPARHPVQGFYGKLGGSFDRRHKGRVLVMYGEGDEALLEIYAGAEAVLPECAVPGVELTVSLANGLSALPRLLTGFDDPKYRGSGATLFKIRDPGRFATVLDEARQDHDKYIFEREAV
jgi:hypothetical protein